jgi:RimJ/RimL family protein N-acetyltransferase
VSEHDQSVVHILIASHDRGGANAIMAVLAKQNWFRQQRLSFYFAGPAQDTFSAELAVAEHYQSLVDIKRLTFDAILCGSSYHSNHERELILWAKDQHIPVLCLIDSWMNLSQRFWLSEQSVYCLPDIISVIDQHCYQKLRTELNGHRPNIVVAGQPYLESLIGRQDHQPPLPAEGGRQILFCSEPMRQNYNMQGQLGYDQFSVFDDLVRLFEHNKVAVTLHLKLHPSETSQDWQALCAQYQQCTFVKVVQAESQLADCLLQVEYVVGMVSMALLEAVLAGKRTFSCQFQRRIALAPEIVQFTEQCLSIEQFWQQMQSEQPKDCELGNLSRIVERSSDRITHFFKSMLQPELQLRQATSCDVDLYFDWANDPDVRAMAFQQAQIEFNVHQRWFANKLQSKDVLLFVAEVEQVAVGQLRLERIKDSDAALLDYSLDRCARGSGLSPVMLQQACDFAFSAGFSNEIIAKVKPQNAASCRALQKAGFILSEHHPDYVEYSFKIK